MGLEIDYMQHAILAARSVDGKTKPNPPVGAVIVYEGTVVGLGATQTPGQDHAEIVAIKQAGNDLIGAEMYVTLEPCSMFGRTPPCVDAIISSGISRLNIAILDPNPNENGHGINKLKAAGIEVSMWEAEELVFQAQQLVESYAKNIVTGDPFITLKYAMSIDGKIATSTGKSKWISGQDSRQEVHRMRYTSDAVLVGIETVISDDPKLTARDLNGVNLDNQPLRVVIDTRGRIPLDSKLVTDGGATLIGCAEMESNKQNRLESLGVSVEKVAKHENGIDLRAVIEVLRSRGILTILIEGGSRIAGNLVDLRIIDKFVVFIAPIVIGGCDSIGPIAGFGIDNISDALKFKSAHLQKYGDDIAIIGYP